MQRQWQFPQQEDISQELVGVVGGYPLLGNLLVRRNLTDPSQAKAFLNPGDYKPGSPEELPGMDRAIQHILSALSKKQKICVWGDFDVDGQTSTALLVQALQELEGNVDYYIPIRAKESHGVNIASLETVIRNGAELVITCDTGISAHAAVEFARQQGVAMVITDHHELPEYLPEADAVINPRLLHEDHPLASLPGVGVAYKLAEGLFDRAGSPTDTNQFLDLVVLGIIADVALLRKDNRYLAQLGLQELRQTKRLGLRKLFEFAELNPAGINEEHIGFVIGPRLNALGRLSDANKAVDFLTTRDELVARLLAIELEGLNAERQLLTSQVYQAALSMIEHDRSLLDGYALVLGFPTWPAGVIGIVASRLVEQLGKPVILLSTPPGELARGSARSIEGVNIIAAITTQKDLLENFGGHPMAAGLSIASSNIERFRMGLSKAVAEQIGGEMPSRPLLIDAEVGLKDITLAMVGEIEKLAPFGAGNPPPTLVARDLLLESTSAFGRSGEHLALTVRDNEGTTRSVVWWQGGNMTLPGDKFDLAFTVHASTYHGQQAVQMEWIDARVQKSDLTLQTTARKREIVDFRNVPDPNAQLDILRSRYRDLEVWAEGESRQKLGGKDRLELSPATYLAIFTIPPSRSTIEKVMKKVEPEVIFLMAQDPGLDVFEKLLHRLAGLVTYAINNFNGEIDLNRMAAACAQEQQVIDAGLQCLAARGFIQVIQESDSTITITNGDKIKKGTLNSADLRLRTFLAETKAFRKYYQYADPAGLL